MKQARRNVSQWIVVSVCLWMAHVAVALRAKEPAVAESSPLAWSGCAARTTLPEPRCSRAAATRTGGVSAGRACCGTQIELWAVSTRHLSPDACAATDLASLRYFRHDGQVWQPVGWQSLATAWQAPGRTCLYIHGNNSTLESACAHGVSLAAAWHELSPHVGTVRLVMWCWPSDRLPVDLATNARIKADWAEQQGFHVARFVSQLPPRTGVGLWGHSYGARVSTSALHLLGGGALDGLTIRSARSTVQHSMRAVLTAAAVEQHWILPGERHGAATRAAERLLVVLNPCDPVLRLFPLLPEEGHGPPALGQLGLPQDLRCREVAACVDELDVSGTLGMGHVSKRYLECPEVIRQIKAYLLQEPAASRGVGQLAIGVAGMGR